MVPTPRAGGRVLLPGRLEVGQVTLAPAAAGLAVRPGGGADVYLTMWGPSEFGPVTGRLRDWDVTARLPEIQVPTLVTGGRSDEARPAPLAVLAKGVPGAGEVALRER